MGAQTTRLLAAVMFTDIVGYTAMMQEDEDNANRQKERHRQVLNERATAFDGKILHYYGDGALTIFNSAYNAVMCGIKIQNDIANPYLPLRIGIHVGDIAYNDEDVYGDAVNIASRLEPLGISGGILISEKVQNEISNHRDIKTKELGTFELKNVKYPLSIFAVTNDGINVPTVRDVKAKSGRVKNRLAVLPFVNMSSERGFEYFGDGLTEEIINGLTKMKGIDVTSRTSAFAYKGQNIDIRTIGEDLMVSHILEGSVRKNQDKIRVTAQLIETGGGFHLWSETYERHLKDIFEIQDGISQEILEKVQKGFEGEESRPKPKAKKSRNKKGAYERYLEGRFELQKHSLTSVRKAMKCFNQAIEKDSSHLKSSIGLAQCYMFLGIYGQMQPRRAYKKAEENIDAVLTLDDQFATAVALSGMIELLLRQDYEKAKFLLNRAYEIDPSNPEVCYNYFRFLNMIGENETALSWMERTLELEPTNLLYNAELGRAYYNLNKFSNALEQYNYTLELDSSFLAALEGKGWTLVAMQKLKKAHKEFEVLQNLVSREQKNIPHLVYTSARLGLDDAADHFIDALQIGDADDSYMASSLDIAMAYLGMEKYDEVFFHLQRAAEDKVGEIYFIFSDPLWDEIKEDSRYSDLLEQLKLTEIPQGSFFEPAN
ncbi:adenylate/guanylate cyclase domain-containing protein [Fodinibius sp.]|uniref:adenylate/guanylate cyclase domain-containing protein n=1 Tax=Fodinibius sp. TaxID=1872440 RepID=UPI002ACE8D62|nr:tetratricopeptide repeat protein [Fodinibius sp.]MDZ7659057.1 adenylate/guanylate cyclase domain-containing protein [Fodinibius sp.]